MTMKKTVNTTATPLISVITTSQATKAVTTSTTTTTMFFVQLQHLKNHPQCSKKIFQTF